MEASLAREPRAREALEAGEQAVVALGVEADRARRDARRRPAVLHPEREVVARGGFEDERRALEALGVERERAPLGRLDGVARLVDPVGERRAADRLGLRREEDPDVRPSGSFSMRGHSVGGFGSVATNRIIATVLGDLFHLRVQAYPLYGSEKKGLPTTYYLTVADDPIHVHSELAHVDFVPLNDVNAFRLGNPLAGLTEGGMLFVQSAASDPEAIWAGIPEGVRQLIAQREIRVLALNTLRIAGEVASRPELRQRMQGIVLLGVFLRVTPFRERRGLDEDAVFAAVERSLRKVFGKRGEQVIRENMTAVRRGYEEVIEIPREVMRGAARPPAWSRSGD